MNLRTSFLLFASARLVATLNAQYDGDDTRYRTIALEDLPAAIARDRDALVLDVRSAGEFADTSNWAGLNIGHLKGAKHISHREVGGRLPELAGHQDKPIYVYCSHSQRSRRVSNLLADSGYMNVVNVNGGLSRYWKEQDRLAALAPLVERGTSYGLLNAERLCELATSRPVWFLDVRPDTLFEPGKMTERMRALGAMTNAVRIPLDGLKARMAEVPRDRTIVIVDEHGADSPRAAILLQEAGISDVHVLFDGLDGMLGLARDRFPCAPQVWSSDVAYTITTLEDLDTLAILTGKMTVLDVRTTEEYEGRAKDAWGNTGRFRIAKHVPAAELKERIASLGIAKKTPVVLLGRTMEEDLFTAARALTDLGYKDVKILASGIWGIRWEAHNLPGKAAWDGWVIGYPTAIPTNP